MPKTHHDPNKVSGLSIGTPWIPHTAELLRSPACRGRSINTVRLIEFLEIEHTNHAGRENGNLCATYDQLVDFGIGRRFIYDAINQAEALRLLQVVQRGGWALDRKNDRMSRFRLTYLPFKSTDDRGAYYCEPTHEWRQINREAAALITGRRPPKIFKQFDKGEPIEATNVHSLGARR